MEKLAHSTPWIPLIFPFFSFLLFSFLSSCFCVSRMHLHIKKDDKKTDSFFSLSFFLIVSPGVGWRVFSLESKATMKEEEYILRQQDGHQQLCPIIVEKISDYFGDFFFITLTWRDRGGGEWNDRNISWLKGWIRKYMLVIWYRQVKGMFNINIWF